MAGRQDPAGGQSAAAGLKETVRALAGNGVVSITAQRGNGRTPFLAGTLRLAGGAPVLAHKTGAALLPVFAFRNRAVVEVTVDPPLRVDPDLPREQAVARAVHDYARRLELYVLRYPGLWLGWVQL